MRYSACFSLIASATLAATGLAEGSENAKVAMHLIASRDSLACEDLVPAGCDSINVDLSSEEVLDADGYGYVVFLAFDADSLSGGEFAVDGWPSGRGAPPKQGPYWCADTPLSLGDVFDGGGIIAFGECVNSGVDGLVPLGYIFFGPLDEDDLPINLSYAASTFSYPDSGHNCVLRCAPDFIEYGVVSHSGCTIGGTYTDSLPQCPETESGGGDDGGDEEDTESVFSAEPRHVRADLTTGSSATTYFELRNDGDLAAAYHLSPSEEWITAKPTSGVINARERIEVVVTLLAPEFPSGTYEGEIRIQGQEETPKGPVVPVVMTAHRRKAWGHCSDLGGVMLQGIDRLGWGAVEVPPWINDDSAMDALLSSPLVQVVERTG
jgi:hypothetical protein